MHNIKLWVTDDGFFTINTSDAYINDVSGKKVKIVDYGDLIKNIDEYKKHATAKFYDDDGREYLFFNCKSVISSWWSMHDDSNELHDGILEIKLKKDCTTRSTIHFDKKINTDADLFLKDYEKIYLKGGNNSTDHSRSLKNAKIEIYI